ncbi:right-handed parallel beta-helix repeat-containing protein [Burkholderia gladioli]|uniref:right-handed parallel beta-helix repeat-containing protein n=1 Tax=Burkholderia gladioli TaxID=28095 RepID=UPI003016887B
MASILPNGRVQFIDQNGKPLVGGSVSFYEPGTTTKIDTYQDSAMTEPNTNPVVLDSRGQATIWGNSTYRQVVHDVSGGLIWDQIVSAAVSFADLSTNGADLIEFDGNTLTEIFSLRLNRVVDSIAQLRTLSKLLYTRAFSTGYYEKTDGGGGPYQIDFDDNDSADNGVTIIVANDGARWKLQTWGPVSLKQAGAKIDGTTKDTAAVTSAITNCLDVYHPGGTCLVDPIVISGLTSHKITGTGMRSAYFALASSGTTFTFSNCQDMLLTRFGIKPNGNIADANGIQFDTGSNINTISFVQVADFTLSGLILLGTSDTQLSGNRVTDCLLLGNKVNNFLSVYSNDFYYHKNQFGITESGVTPQVGCYLQNSGAGTYTENYHWQNVVGLRALNSNYTRIENNRADINQQQGMYFDSCVRTTVLGNDVHSNSTSSPGTYDDTYFVNCDTIIYASDKIFTWDPAITQRFSAYFDVGCNNISLGGGNKMPNGWTLAPYGFSPSLVNAIITGDFEVALSVGLSGPIAANTTIFFGQFGASASQSAVAVANGAQRQLFRLTVECDNAPGAGQTFIYRLFKNGVDTGVALQINGTGQFSATTIINNVLLAQNDFYCLQLQTSAGAAPAYHRANAEFASY